MANRRQVSSSGSSACSAGRPSLGLSSSSRSIRRATTNSSASGRSSRPATCSALCDSRASAVAPRVGARRSAGDLPSLGVGRAAAGGPVGAHHRRTALGMGFVGVEGPGRPHGTPAAPPQRRRPPTGLRPGRAALRPAAMRAVRASPIEPAACDYPTVTAGGRYTKENKPKRPAGRAGGRCAGVAGRPGEGARPRGSERPGLTLVAEAHCCGASVAARPRPGSCVLRCELRLGRVVRWRWDGKAKVQAAAAYHSATSTPGKRPTHMLQPNTKIQIEFKF